MSFTTRCPACGTMFRVVADQLKISDGWVRCGHCSDVFDATIQLEAWVPPHDARPATTSAAPVSSPVPPAQPTPPAPSAPLTATVANGSAAIATQQDDLQTRAPEDDLAAWFGDEPLPPAPTGDGLQASTSTPSVDPDFHSELQQFASAHGRSSGPAALTDVPALIARSAGQDDDAPRVIPAGAAAPEPDQTAEVPGFVRQARRRAFWSSPAMQTAVGLLTLLLALLLAGQWTLQERHRLVVSQPMLKPWIEQACGLLGCTLEPVRRIDAIVIDSSELVRRLGNFYSFDLVVKNTAAIDVAVPALELSLTDSSDAVIARRVFLPQEWPNAPALLAANGQLAVSFRLSLTLAESTPMAGYRALVFYP